MKTRIHYIVLFFLMVGTLHAQNIGVATQTPDAPFHVYSSGQLHTPDGLVLFGDRNEGHMMMDFGIAGVVYFHVKTALIESKTLKLT